MLETIKHIAKKYWGIGRAIRLLILLVIVIFAISISAGELDGISIDMARLWLIVSLMITLIYSSSIYISQQTQGTIFMRAIQCVVSAFPLALAIIIFQQDMSVFLASILVGPVMVSVLFVYDWLGYREHKRNLGETNSETRKARSIILRLNIPILVGVVVVTLIHAFTHGEIVSNAIALLANYSTSPNAEEVVGDLGNNFVAGATAMQVVVGNLALECFLID